jgi:hypothetical protein
MHRNGFQVLGKNLNCPSSYLVCYTADGKISGGTGQAMRIATELKIPIYNLYHDSDIEKLMEMLDE